MLSIYRDNLEVAKHINFFCVLFKEIITLVSHSHHNYIIYTISMLLLIILKVV